MRKSTFKRGSVEFDRLVSLTDGIYGVAMTLLAFTVGIPQVAPEELKKELLSAHGQLLTFFIAFAVLAFYWLSNHHFVRHLKAIDSVYIGLKLIYLSLVALLPLPTALLDRYSQERITVVIYLSVLLLLSLLELALFGWAHHAKLFTSQPHKRVVRYSILIALIPVFVFGLAIPVGLHTSPTYALAIWILLNFPLRIAVERRLGPSTYDAFL